MMKADFLQDIYHNICHIVRTSFVKCADWPFITRLVASSYRERFAEARQSSQFGNRTWNLPMADSSRLGVIMRWKMFIFVINGHFYWLYVKIKQMFIETVINFTCKFYIHYTIYFVHMRGRRHIIIPECRFRYNSCR